MNFPSRIWSALALLALLSACTKSHDSSGMGSASSPVAANPTAPSGSQPPSVLSEPSAPPTLTAPVKLSVQNDALTTAEYFRLVDELRALAKVDSDDAVAGLSTRLYNGFYANPKTTLPLSFLQGPIPSALVGEGEQPIRDAVTKLQADLTSSLQALDKILNGSANGGYPWPKALPKLAVALEAVDQYVQWLENQVQALDIDGPLKAAALQGLEQQYAKERPSLVAATTGIDDAKRLSDSVASVQKAVKGLGITLTSADAAQLKQAAGLGAQLNSMQTAQDALAVIVTVWEITPVAQREPVFEKVSPDLYNFLKGTTPDDLTCLAHPHCLNIILGIEKGTIFSKIEAYGIEKIHDQVDAAGRTQIAAAVSAQALKTLPTLPLTIRDAVTKQAAPYFALIEKALADVPGFTRTHVQAWAGKQVKQGLRGLEVGAVQVSVGGGGAARVTPAAAADSVVATGAEAIGASLALSHAFLPLDNATALQSAMLEPIQRELAIGGFRQDGGKPFPGLLLPLSGPINQVLSLDNLGDLPTPFAVPDSFRANAVFQMDRQHAARNAGAGAQAELLKGLAREIRFYRDWEENEYDVTLGKVLVQDLVPEMPQGLVSATALPKSALFALTLAQAGALLDNWQLGPSPLFSVAADGSVTWGAPAEMVGIASIVDGNRAAVAYPADAARMLLAIDELLSATGGVENSTAAFLQRKTRSGQSTLLADVLAYRQKLTAVEFGLAQFLAHAAIQSDGSVAAELKLGAKLSATATPLRLEDQALAIRALLVAARSLDQLSLRDAALTVYGGLNRNFGQAVAQFYPGQLDPSGKGARAASLQEVTLTLLAGEELSDAMSADQKKLWSAFARPWLTALEAL